jgi:DNA-binding transcriptional regulator YiaG
LYCAKILEEFEINKNYTDQEFGPEKKFVTDYNNNNIIQVVQLKGTRHKYMTNHAKFKLMEDQGKKMAQLSSEVSTPIFCERLKIIQSIIKHWEEGQDKILKDIFKDNFAENTRNEH